MEKNSGNGLSCILTSPALPRRSYQQSCWWARLSHKDSNSFCMMITGWRWWRKGHKMNVLVMASDIDSIAGVTNRDLVKFFTEWVTGSTLFSWLESGGQFWAFSRHVTDLWRKVYLRSNSFSSFCDSWQVFVTHYRGIVRNFNLQMPLPLLNKIPSLRWFY